MVVTTRLAETELSGDDIGGFATAMRGALVQPGEPAYDEVRRLYNGMINKRPRLIARCVDTADVIAAVNFGRQHGLLVAIRGGGHNGPGLGSCDGGLVIDLALMKGVRVEPARGTVRVERGAPPGTSTMPHIRSDWQCHLESFLLPASRVSHWAEVSAISLESMV